MTTTDHSTFNPPFHLRHPALQTVLASIGMRRWQGNPMQRASAHRIMDAGDGIRLSGYYSPVKQGTARGLVILLHGWEGSTDSTYVLSCGRYLYQHGFDVFRLNYRDHGDSHHLNEDLFYATRLEEVYQAVRQAAGLSQGVPVFLAGFSLGGNFTLRIAMRCADNGIDRLKHIVSISPVLDPDKATSRIDGNPFLLSYFIKKWKKSLARKQRIFPERYDFDDILRQGSIRKMTEMLLKRYSPYPDTKTYFKAYGIFDGDMARTRVPTTIITAVDDPVIPVEDFSGLKTSPSTDLVMHAMGGHNGFIDSMLGPAWYDRFMLDKFSLPETHSEA